MSKNASFTCESKRTMRTCLAVGAIAALAIPATFAMSAPAHAAETTTKFEGMTFVADDENVAAGATVTAYDKAEGPEVVIPEKIDIDGVEYPVTKIGDYAFSGKGLTSVVLPETITRIGVMAFLNGKMESIVIPDSVEWIGQQAFQDGALTSLELPETDITLNIGVFWGNKLTYVDLPDGVLKIEGLAFADNELTDIELPPKLQIMGDEAFARNNLSEVNLPSTIWQMTGNVFTDNSEDMDVYFEGKAPRLFNGADHRQPSLGKAEYVTVHFGGEFEARSDAEGFTQPLWKGYNSVGSEWIKGLSLSTPATTIVEGTSHPFAATTVNAIDLDLAEVTDDATFSLNGVPVDGNVIEFPVDLKNAGKTVTYEVTADWKKGAEPRNRAEVGTYSGAVDVEVESSIDELRLDFLGTAEDLVAMDGEVVVAEAYGLKDGVEVADLSDHITFTSTAATDAIDGNTVTVNGMGERKLTATVGNLSKTVTILVNEDGEPEVVVPEPESTNPDQVKPTTPAGNGAALANTGGSSLLSAGLGALALLAAGAAFMIRRTSRS